MKSKLSLFTLALLFTVNAFSITQTPLITDGIIEALKSIAPISCSEVVIDSNPTSTNENWSVRQSFSYECQRLDKAHHFQVSITTGRNPAMNGLLFSPINLGSDISVSEFQEFLKKAASAGTSFFRNGSWGGAIYIQEESLLNFPGTIFRSYFSQSDQSADAILEGSFEGQVIYLYLGLIG